MKTIVLATLAAAALAAPVAAQSSLDAQIAPYVDNAAVLSVSQKATIKGLTESDFSRSELQSRIDAVVN